MTTEPTNKDRRLAAIQTVVEHAQRRNNYDPHDFRAMVVDLLTDIHHLCKAKRLGIGALLVTAEMHFATESSEEK